MSTTQSSAPPPAAAQPVAAVSETSLGWGGGGPSRGSVVFGLLIVLVVVLILCCYLRPRAPPLGARLARAGWVLYFTPTCGWCKKQLALFEGRRGRGLVAVKCVGKRKAAGGVCAGITGFPLWKNERTGVERSGFQNLESLRRMAM